VRGRDGASGLSRGRLARSRGLFDVAGGSSQPRTDDLTHPRLRGGRCLRCYHIPKTVADFGVTPGDECALGRGNIRPDGSHSGPCGGIPCRLCRQTQRLRRKRGSNTPRTSCATTNMRGTTTNISPTPSCRGRRSIVPSLRTSSPIPRFMPAWLRERDGGIVAQRRAGKLGTGAVFSDAVYISCIHPLIPGDEAICLRSIAGPPASAPGVEDSIRGGPMRLA